jgi:hypothetical protein
MSDTQTGPPGNPANSGFADGLFGFIKSISTGLNEMMQEVRSTQSDYVRKFQEATKPAIEAMTQAGQIAKDVGVIGASIQGKDPDAGYADEAYRVGKGLQSAAKQFETRTAEARERADDRRDDPYPVVSESRGRTNLEAMERKILADKKLNEEQKIKALNQLAARAAAERKRKEALEKQTASQKRQPPKGKRTFRRRR